VTIMDDCRTAELAAGHTTEAHYLDPQDRAFDAPLIAALSPLAGYKYVTADYAPRFRGLDAARLFAVENEHGDCDYANQHVERLVAILADWQTRLTALCRTLSASDMDEATRAFIARETATWTAARDDAYRAYAEWSFTSATEKADGTIVPCNDGDVPTAEPFPPLPLPADDPTAECTIDGCDGSTHGEGWCWSKLGTIGMPDAESNSFLIAEIGKCEDEPEPYVVAYGFCIPGDVHSGRITDPAKVEQMAAEARRWADALDRGAARLRAMHNKTAQ
jgi:hypothetical protein